MRFLPTLGLFLVARAACAADEPPYPFSFEEVRVAPGIVAFIEKPGHAIVSGNSIAIAGDDAVAVVDTGQHPRLTRAIVERLRASSPKPVAYVINTHWHNDHVAGNAVYAQAYPDARFIAHAFTAKMLESEIGPYMKGGCTRFLERESAPLRAMVASGKGADGSAIAPARMSRLREVIVDADAATAECGEFRLRASDIAFEKRLTLELGHRDVEVLHLGRANTAGDAIVYVPDAKVVMTGDVLVYPFPFATQSYIREWAAVLRRIEAMDADTIIPGHGPVMHDKAYLRLIAELMESIDARVGAAWRPGITLDELRKQVDLADFRARIAGDSAFVGANFDAMARSAVERAWQEREGKLEPEGLPRG